MLRQSTDRVSLAQYKSEYERMGYEVTKVKMTDLGALAKHPHVWTTKFDMKIKKQGDNMATLVKDETLRKSWVKSMLDLDDRIVSVKLTKPSSFTYVVRVDLTDGKSLEVHVDKSLAVYSGNVDAYIRSEVALHLPPRNERILFIGGHSDGEWHDVAEGTLWHMLPKHVVSGVPAWRRYGGSEEFGICADIPSERYERQRIYLSTDSREYQDYMLLQGMSCKEALLKLMRQYKGITSLHEVAACMGVRP